MKFILGFFLTLCVTWVFLFYYEIVTLDHEYVALEKRVTALELKIK